MKFRMQRGKSVRKVIRKLFAFHLKRCRALLAGSEASANRIHEVRKSVKRLRALVSLVGDALCDDRRWFDKRLRDVNRFLSPVRDSESLREAFDRLTAAEANPPDEFAAVRAVLWSWSERNELLPETNHHKLLHAIDGIDKHWRKFKLSGRGWSLLEDNIREAYTDAREALIALPTNPAAADLHEFRKRVKVTQYHWDFLQTMAPDLLESEVAALEDLSDTLGHHHDYEMLKDWLREHARHVLSEHTRQLACESVLHQQRELERHALACAPALFTLPPKQMVRRLHKLWKAWRKHVAVRRPANPPLAPAVLQNVGP